VARQTHTPPKTLWKHLVQWRKRCNRHARCGHESGRLIGAFLKQFKARRSVLKAQFEAIDALDYQPRYDDALERVNAFLLSLD
jgi:hypothetical protein